MIKLIQKETYAINRIELRHLLLSLGSSEKSIARLLNNMEKMHRHVNILSFVAMLEKMNITQEKIVNVFRRFGLDDVIIHNILNSVDEERILAETGRLYTISFK